MDSSRKQALLAEFETIIAPQKAQLAQRLPHLFQQYDPPAALPVGARPGAGALPGAGLNKGGSVKRPQFPAVGPDPKRPRTGGPVDEADKRGEMLFKEIMSLINRKLWGKKECVPFKEPVDPIKLRIPDYYNYIKKPMDLGTVKTKLQQRLYSTPLEVCEDIRLIWRNCATYNQPGNPVRLMGDQMGDIWEKAWAESRIEEQWNELMYMKDPSGRAVPYKLNQLNTQLKTAVQTIPAPTDGNTERQMSEIEKRKLSTQLGELQGDQLQGVIDIVQADMANLDTSGEEEIELDMDALPHATLWKLRQFVDGTLRGHRGSSMVAPHKRAPAPTTNGDTPAAGGAAAPKPQQSVEEVPRDEPSEMGSSESEQDSPQEVKGSTMDDPHVQNASAFVKDGRQLVDESATAPREQSTILKDKPGARKAEVQVNADNWNVSALQQPQAVEEEQAGGEDEMWENFRTIEEQKRKQAEEQRKLKEQQEEELRKKKEAEEEEAKRAAAEAEERERKLKEEEERIAAEEQRARQEQCDKEVDEIKAQQGTANLVQQNDMQGLLAHVQPGSSDGGLAAVGLVYKNDDEDVNFDDDD